MSADHGYTWNRIKLLAEGRKITSCKTFTVEAHGSRHHCGGCGKTLLEHIIVAQRSKPTVDADPGGGVKQP